MFNNKLISLLKTLSAKELSQFSDFVHSPYFNKHEQVKALCDYLLAFAPQFSSKSKLDKEIIFAKLFPSKNYDDNFFASIISKLLKVLEDFLVQIVFEEKESEKSLYLLQALQARKLEKHYRMAEKNCIKALEQSSETTTERLNRAMRLAREQDLWFLTQGGRTYNKALQQQSDFLDSYFLLEKMRLACDMHNRNIVTKANYSCELLEEVTSYLKKQPDIVNKQPLLAIYTNILALLQQPEEELHYKQLKQKIAETAEKLTKIELRGVYDYALNYCVQQINIGKKHYYTEILELYRRLLDAELIFIGGELPAWEYKNIVTAALRCTDFEWTRQFLDDYKERLPAEQRENAYCYNLASYYYASGQHKKALQSLHNVIFTDSTYHIGAKLIQLKSYFELAEWETLYATLDAFTAYLRRHKEIAEYQKKANMNFIAVCRPLARLKEQEEWKKDAQMIVKQQKIKTLIDSLNPLAGKDWLLEQWEKQ